MNIGGGKSWDDSSNTNPVQLAGRGIILVDTTTEGDSALDATIQRELLMRQCAAWHQEMMRLKSLITECLTTLDTTSEKQQSTGSPAFTWTFQQLSNTEWSGLPVENSSSSSSETVGKHATLETAGAIKEDRAARTSPAGMLTSVSTSMKQAYRDHLTWGEGWY